MSLLTIAQNVAREVGFEPPAFISGNTDATARQLLALANREGKILSKRNNWSVLQKEYVFNTVANQESYDLPNDFNRFLDDTIWDRSALRPLEGPASAQIWQARKSGGAAYGGVYSRYRVKGSVSGSLKFYVNPAPLVSGQSLAFEYVSSHWCKNSLSGLTQSEWLDDSDESLLPEELISFGVTWRFLLAKGLEYAPMFAEYENQVLQYMARDGGMLSFGQNRASPGLISPHNFPYDNFGQ